MQVEGLILQSGCALHNPEQQACAFDLDRVNLKPACLLLCLAHAHSVAALGLGDLDLRSALGQPLHATVKILAPGASDSTECFTVQAAADAISALPRTQLELERRGEQAVLHIRSAQAVNEPVLQFAVTAECETRLRREYVLLLDPPAAITPPAVAEAPPAAVAADAAAAVPRARPATRVRTAGATRTPSARTRAPAPTAPRLVLSGRRLAGVGADGLALRLDTGLPDLNRPRTETLTATELSDENTALTRKLAHLESQLGELQRRNAELEARKSARAATASTPAAAEPQRTGAPQWPLYLLLAGLVTAAGGLIVWMRRRNRTSLARPDDAWHPHPPTPTAAVTATAVADDWTNVTQPAHPADGDPELPAMNIEPPRRAEPMFGMLAVEENPEVKDDILDQAEVFMAHGHGDFAIHLLQEHLREAPDESPVPWLLLLDLLHRAGDNAGYAAASTQCRRHYNIDLTQPPVSQDGEIGPGLEAYRHVMDRVVQMWRSAEIMDFLRDLIYDDRGGTRVGFEPGAYRDILLLRDIAGTTLASGE